MDDAKRMQLLKYALILVGIIFIFVIYPFTIIWPSVGNGTAGKEITTCR